MLSTWVSKVETRFAQADELIIVCIFLAFAFAVFGLRRRKELSVEMTTQLKRTPTHLEHELSEHVLTEKALSESQELFQNAFDYAPTGIILASMDGHRRNHPGLRIIAMSGGGRNSAQDYLKLAKSFGADYVLTKPFSNQAILDVVKTVLASPPQDSASLQSSESLV